jgi:hypothetical protein
VARLHHPPLLEFRHRPKSRRRAANHPSRPATPTTSRRLAAPKPGALFSLPLWGGWPGEAGTGGGPQAQRYCEPSYAHSLSLLESSRRPRAPPPLSAARTPTRPARLHRAVHPPHKGEGEEGA